MTYHNDVITDPFMDGWFPSQGTNNVELWCFLCSWPNKPLKKAEWLVKWGALVLTSP